jgi:hypothetical protein
MLLLIAECGLPAHATVSMRAESAPGRPDPSDWLIRIDVSPLTDAVAESLDPAFHWQGLRRHPEPVARRLVDVQLRRAAGVPPRGVEAGTAGLGLVVGCTQDNQWGASAGTVGSPKGAANRCSEVGSARGGINRRPTGCDDAASGQAQPQILIDRAVGDVFVVSHLGLDRFAIGRRREKRLQARIASGQLGDNRSNIVDPRL